ncbi:phage tail tape measure protein [Citrobacter sp. S2-9]|uniref:Phage tail tape measure protein n=1 Tax=Citrobacter enshiensis TaxID=2971264 RepID=A0ABT8PQK7_9ENTR|nr:phage tail tape measure protein [Citrobacter enshiensis]MDN8598616.1 phage tail tape measure protein [Citrobacter enshiensis]
MSATVIDALLVTLGLDPSAFTAGTNEVTKDLGKLKKESESTSKAMAEEGKKAAEFFRSIRNEMLALIGVTLTLKGVKDILIDTTHSMADLGRVSTLIGESARTVDAWGNAVKGFGGDAKTMQATMLGLEDSITSFQMTGRGNGTIQAFRSMGIQFMDEHGKARKSSDLLLDVARYFEKVHATPQQARQFGKMAGIDQATINMLMQGSEATKRYVAEQERNSAVTAQAIRNAQEMERAWASLDSQWQAAKLTLTEALQPQIKQVTQLLKEGGDWIRDHRGEINQFFQELPGKIKPIIDDVQQVVKFFGGWENIAKALIGLQLASWIGSVATSLAGLAASLTTLAPLMATLYYIKWLYDNKEDVGTTFKGSYDYAKKNIEDSLRNFGFDIPLGPNQVKGTPQTALDIPGVVPAGSLPQGSEPEQRGQSVKIPQAVGKGAALLGMMAGTFGQLEAKYQLPTGLLNSVATTESGGNQFAVSSAGAQGLFQLMPGTAKGLGLKEGEQFDPQKSSEAAARYLSSLLKQFGGDVNTALAAYNWGPGNVAKKGLGNMPAETKAYLQKVTGGMPVGAGSRYAFAPPAMMNAPTVREVHNETHIGQITIQTQATDANAMAKELPGALRRTPLIYQADQGMS